MPTHDVPDSELPAGAGTAGEVVPIPSASTIVLRGESPFEILLMRRHERSSFVPGVWVFPGGVMEEVDRAGDPLETMKRCALRELREETGIDVEEASRLVWTARWITPESIPKRFDTWFFLLRVDEETVAVADQQEGVEVLWITPHEALERHAAARLPMVFPTIRNIETLARSGSASGLLESRRVAVIPTTRPVLVEEDGQKKIILPE